MSKSRKRRTQSHSARLASSILVSWVDFLGLPGQGQWRRYPADKRPDKDWLKFFLDSWVLGKDPQPDAMVMTNGGSPHAST